MKARVKLKASQRRLQSEDECNFQSSVRGQPADEQRVCEQSFVEDLPPSSDGEALDPGRRSIKRKPTAVISPASVTGGYRATEGGVMHHRRHQRARRRCGHPDARQACSDSNNYFASMLDKKEASTTREPSKVLLQHILL